MSNLTAKYRPQTFASVAGQETLKTILSRAALEDKVAPAYLFSGTRGVGKTTLARIFAKALNCRLAPTAEPCNECDQCRAVTLGNAVDVIEIDGASNRGIDDVRRLKEVVGYAPMEGRYKVFIIDEAHMLSREAFNALLKTLEEPPTHVTFIMATTEPHKFPATIISRCQHYVFKRLAEQELITHLSSVLEREHLPFEASAVRLIARRGAGSVRDSMSLLGQVMALGDGVLNESTTRSVLGLAGQEVLFSIATTLAKGESLPLVHIMHELMDQGLDIGFFLRELGSLWRNMFILRQSGAEGITAIPLPQEEAEALLDLAQLFSLAHIHAAWQMTLEGQRRVLTSLEPGLALELLLLNLAMLPQLLSLDALSTLGRRQGAPSTQGGAAGGTGGASQPSFPQTPPLRPAGPPPAQNPRTMPPQVASPSAGAMRSTTPASSAPPAVPQLTPAQKMVSPSMFPESTTPTLQQPHTPGADDSNVATVTAAKGLLNQKSTQNPTASANLEQQAMQDSDASTAPPTISEMEKKTPSAEINGEQPPSVPLLKTQKAQDESETQRATAVAAIADEHLSKEPPTASSALSMPVEAPTPANINNEPAWDDIVAYCRAHDAPAWFSPLLRNATGLWNKGALHIQPKDSFTANRIFEKDARAVLDPALRMLCGAIPAIVMEQPLQKPEDRSVLKETIYANPVIKNLEETFEARILDFGRIKQ